MAVQLVNFSSGAWGIASNELGCNLEEYNVDVEPEVNEWIPSINNTARGKAVSTELKGEMTMSGETLGLSTASSIFQVVPQTAFSPVNSTAYFGRTGGWYWDSGSIKNSRAGLQKFSAKLSSRSNVS